MQRHWKTLAITALVLASNGGLTAARRRGAEDASIGWRDRPPQSTLEEQTSRREPLAAIASSNAARADKEIVVRSGAWRGPAGIEGRWRARLESHRGDGTLSGEVTIDGPLGATRGRVEGRIRGRNVHGTVSDDEGHRIARFSGSASGDSFSGRYETVEGDRGTWSCP